MAVVVVCIALVVAGLAAVAGWGGLAVEPPPASAGASGQAARPTGPLVGPLVGLVVRRYLWYLTVAVIAGVGAGVLAAGAGGRLVMRLLAVTAGTAAQGQITEADQIVGRITSDGTVGFIVFTGLFFGLASGLGYLLVHRVLPAGRVGGLVYGALLLVVAGTRLEPLRANNPDFDLVGPSWLAVVAFSVLVVVHGMLVAALAGRVSRMAPLLDWRPGAIAAHAPLVLLAPAVPVLVLLVGVGALVVAVTQSPRAVAAWQAGLLVVAGRVALVVVALVAAPGFVAAVADIAGQG